MAFVVPFSFPEIGLLKGTGWCVRGHWCLPRKPGAMVWQRAGHSWPPRIGVEKMERTGAPVCRQAGFVDRPGGAARRDTSRVPCCSQLGSPPCPQAAGRALCASCLGLREGGLRGVAESTGRGHFSEAALSSPQAHSSSLAAITKSNGPNGVCPDKRVNGLTAASV